MDVALDNLPSDPEALRAIIAAQADALAEKDARLRSSETLIEKLKAQLAVLKRARFGASSEKIDRAIEQLELALEEIEASDAEDTHGKEKLVVGRPKAKPTRRPLPEHLPRETVEQPAAPSARSAVASTFAGTARRSRRRSTTSRPRSGWCGTYPAPRLQRLRDGGAGKLPALPIERGKPGPGLVAHVLTAKYCDHLPLHRQSGIYAREGVEMARSTMADWVGSAAALAPLVEASKACAGRRPAPRRRHAGAGAGARPRATKTGRLWAYVRDGRPCGSDVPPAVAYFYSPDRKGKHPQAHLKNFRGVLHADGYAGFKDLYQARARTGTRRSAKRRAGRMRGASSST